MSFNYRTGQDDNTKTSPLNHGHMTGIIMLGALVLLFALYKGFVRVSLDVH